MDSPLVTVFLAVIALTALLQAGFVAALAFGVRLGARKLALLEESFEGTVVPQLRNAARLTDKAADLAAKSLAEARRADAVVAEASRRTERYLDDATRRVERFVDRTAARVESEIETRTARLQDNRVVRRLSTVSALAMGLRRALEVWQATAEAEADASGDGGGWDGDDEQAPPDDPSPA